MHAAGLPKRKYLMFAVYQSFAIGVTKKSPTQTIDACREHGCVALAFCALLVGSVMLASQHVNIHQKLLRFFGNKLKSGNRTPTCARSRCQELEVDPQLSPIQVRHAAADLQTLDYCAQYQLSGLPITINLRGGGA